MTGGFGAKDPEVVISLGPPPSDVPVLRLRAHWDPLVLVYRDQRTGEIHVASYKAKFRSGYHALAVMQEATDKLVSELLRMGVVFPEAVE